MTVRLLELSQNGTTRVKPHVQGSGMKGQAVFSTDLKQKSLHLIGNVHGHAVGRKGQASRLGCIVWTFQYGGVFTILVPCVDASSATSIFRKEEQLGVIVQNALDLIRPTIE
jgi:hypothetical protein